MENFNNGELKMDSINKTPHPIDLHVGERIKLRRKILKMSQSQLADAIGITFQQVQKYEKGSNRVGAGRLFDIGNVLGVEVSFFFHELSANEYAKNKSKGSSYIKSNPVNAKFGLSLGTESDPITSNETLKLIQMYNKMPEEARNQILSLCQVMTKSSQPRQKEKE